MRSPLLAAALTLALLPIAAPSLSAAPARWTRIGPEGGNACALTAAPSQPSLLYAGFTLGGVFRSADRGQTWTFAGRGLWKANAACSLAVDANAPGTVWAGTAQGLFKSADRGGSWARKSALTSPAHPSVSAVLAHPQRSGFLWAAVPGGGLFRTRDGGATWQRLGLGIQGDITVLAVDPTHPSTLYAGTAQGAFKSTDTGVTWRLLPQRLTFSPAVQTLAVDLRNPRRIFLAPAGGQLLKSTDGGASWSYSTAGLGSLVISSIAFDAVKPAVMYAATHSLGVYKSTDSGRTWKPTGPGIPGSVVNAVIASPAGVFAASTGGVAASADQGASWHIGRGLSATVVSALTVSSDVSSQDPPRLYASQADLIWKSADRGGFWLPIPPSIPIPVTSPVAVDPSAPERLYAGLQGALAASTDGGRHWSLAPGFLCTTLSRVVIDPVTPSTIYTGGPVPPTILCARFFEVCSALKSTDSGATWSCLRDDRDGSGILALDPFAPSHLYARSFFGLDRSLDGGATWALLAPGIAAADLAFDPHTPGLVYAALPAGVGRSTDGGATWQIHAAGLRNEAVLHLSLDPVDPSILYAATLNQVFRSTDAGSTWALAGPGLEEVQVLDVDVDPADPSIVYAATAGGSVMKLDQE